MDRSTRIPGRGLPAASLAGSASVAGHDFLGEAGAVTRTIVRRFWPLPLLAAIALAILAWWRSEMRPVAAPPHPPPALAIPARSPAPAAPPPAAPPVSVRGLGATQQLAAAFRAAYGGRAHPTTRRGAERLDINPAALLWSGDTAILLTFARIPDGCHACQGAIGVHYLVPEGAGFAVRGRWPLLVEGSSLGEPTAGWSIRRDLGPDPMLVSYGSFDGQGEKCTWATLVALAPGRPLPRGRAFTGYDNVGTAVDPAKATRWNGRIRAGGESMTIAYSGSETFTEHYRLQGGRYRPDGPSRLDGKCG